MFTNTIFKKAMVENCFLTQASFHPTFQSFKNSKNFKLQATISELVKGWIKINVCSQSQMLI